MSAWSKEELENMLFDVVNELDLSDGMIDEHGPLGTAPATLVRLVLERKGREIKMLKLGFVCIAERAKHDEAIKEAAKKLLKLRLTDVGGRKSTRQTP